MKKVEQDWGKFTERMMQHTRPDSGTDPEIFVLGGDGKVIPAWKFLPSKKEALEKEKEAALVGSNGYPAFWDGFQAEWSTPGQSCLEGLSGYVGAGLRKILKEAQRVDRKAKLSLKSVVFPEKEDLQNGPEECVMLGCSPSKNAYGNDGMKVDDPRGLRPRFAGMHIHLGTAVLREYYNKNGYRAYYPKDPELHVKIVKNLDSFLGVASISMAQGMEDPIRRMFYGLAGEYREPKHGLEYRVLSNFPLSHPAVYYMVFELARGAYKLTREGLLPEMMGPSELCQEIINNSDVKLAKVWLKKNWDLYTHWAHKVWYPMLDADYPKALERLLMGGVGEVVKNPEEIIPNWNSSSPRWRQVAPILETGKQI